MLWSKEFELGIEMIDKQHKKLFDIIDKSKKVEQDIRDNIDSYDEIMLILEEMEHYTRIHFAYEEGILERTGYDSLEDQKYEHESFLFHVHEIIGKDFDYSQLETIQNINDYLYEWLKDHIMIKDAAYVPHVLAQEGK